jgi:hypothetical protein
MSTVELQTLLARLYTDEELLSEFLRDRTSFCSRLEGRARDLIERLDEHQLQFFVASLRRKRCNEVSKLLPMTASAMGAGFFEEFHRYSASVVPTGERKHAADSMAFCEWLLQGLRCPDEVAREAATYELLNLRLNFRLVRKRGDPVVCRALRRRLPWIKLKRFNYQLPALTGEQTRPNKRLLRPALVAFVRLPRIGGIWYS